MTTRDYELKVECDNLIIRERAYRMAAALLERDMMSLILASVRIERIRETVRCGIIPFLRKCANTAKVERREKRRFLSDGRINPKK